MFKLILEDGFILEDKHTYSNYFISLINEYINSDYAFDALDKIVEYFSNIYLYCFHLTRLMEEEIEDIKTNGLKTSSRKLMINKIELIYKKQLISNDEYEKLKKIRFYEHHNSDDINSIYFIPYNPNKAHNEGLLIDYGGEQFFSMIEQCKEIDGELLKEKLRKESIPCMLIFRITPETLVRQLHREKNMVDLINDLCDFYVCDTFYNFITDKRLKSNINIYKIVMFDEKDIERIKQTMHYIDIIKSFNNEG